MSYYFSRVLALSFESAATLAAEKLKDQSIGIITKIDVTKTLREQIGVDFRPYRILGACNPALADEALKLEDKVGTMLPCYSRFLCDLRAAERSKDFRSACRWHRLGPSQ